MYKIEPTSKYGDFVSLVIIPYFFEAKQSIYRHNMYNVQPTVEMVIVLNGHPLHGSGALQSIQT